jgi:hypothetical protein
MIKNKPATAKRFPNRNRSEDYQQEQGTSKNFQAVMTYVQIKSFGLPQWRWSDGLAERLAPSLTFCSTFVSRKKWNKEESPY